MKLALDAVKQAENHGIDLKRLPRHVGIIMDGNGRWAASRAMPRIVGHHYGAAKAKEIFKFSAQLGLKAISLYTFSKENWKRPRMEIVGLMAIFEKYITDSAKEIIDSNIRFRTLGDLSDFPRRLIAQVNQLVADTQENTGTQLTLALGYGGRDEIVGACRKIAEQYRQGQIQDLNEITEASFENQLESSELPPLDLMIRTSGEFRISNFFLWQIAYAEMVFRQEFWPDFSADALLDSILEYQKRDRRFGDVVEHVKSSSGHPDALGLAQQNA